VHAACRRFYWLSLQGHLHCIRHSAPEVDTLSKWRPPPDGLQNAGQFIKNSSTPVVWSAFKIKFQHSFHLTFFIGSHFLCLSRCNCSTIIHLGASGIRLRSYRWEKVTYNCPGKAGIWIPFTKGFERSIIWLRESKDTVFSSLKK